MLLEGVKYSTTIDRIGKMEETTMASVRTVERMRDSEKNPSGESGDDRILSRFRVETQKLAVDPQPSQCSGLNISLKIVVEMILQELG